MALALRGIWVLGSSAATPDSASLRVLYAKRFPCCETLCSALLARPLPESDSEVAALIAAHRNHLLLSSGAFALLQNTMHTPSSQALLLPESSRAPGPPPPFASPPVCFVCVRSVFIACVPVCPDVLCATDGSIDDAAARPILTAAIWFLHIFSESVGRVDWTASAGRGEVHLSDFVSKLCAALPMGRPSAFCEGASAAACMASKGFIPQSTFSWRPVAPARSKRRLELKMREIVCAHVYGRTDKPDVVTCGGIITCLADVDDSPDITLTIKNARALAHVRVHACAQRPEVSNGVFTLSFSPPIDRVVLARYNVECTSLPDSGLPFAAEYEVLALPDGSAALSLSVQTAASCTAAVSQVRALLPLQGWKGLAISGAKFLRSPPTGSSFEIHSGAQALVLTLPAPSAAPCKVSIRVEFGGSSQAYPAVDMPFIQGTATCALLQFSTSRLISGLTFDVEHFSCHPSMSLECVADLSSTSYRNSSGFSQFLVWNKYGQSPD
jgi:hypothetical protein